jgi:hypothetical protein
MLASVDQAVAKAAATRLGSLQGIDNRRDLHEIGTRAGDKVDAYRSHNLLACIIIKRPLRRHTFLKNQTLGLSAAESGSDAGADAGGSEL